jgi:hypothetical protein
MTAPNLHQPERGADESMADYQVRRERANKLTETRFRLQFPQRFNHHTAAHRSHAQPPRLLPPFRRTQIATVCWAYQHFLR